MSIKKRIGEGIIGAALGGTLGYAAQREGSTKDKLIAAGTGAALGAGGAVAASHGIRNAIASKHRNATHDSDYQGFTSSYLGRYRTGTGENSKRLGHLDDRSIHLNRKLKHEDLTEENKKIIGKRIKDAEAEAATIRRQMEQHSENVYNQKTKDLKSKMFGVL